MTIISKPLDGVGDGDDGDGDGGGDEDEDDVDVVGPASGELPLLAKMTTISKPLDQLLSLESAIVKAHIFGSPPFVADEDDGATSHHYGGDVDDNDDNGEVADIDGLHCSEGQL